jgi:hypothetical protein
MADIGIVIVEVTFQGLDPSPRHIELATLISPLIFVIEKPVKAMGFIRDVKNTVVSSAGDGDRGDSCLKMGESLCSSNCRKAEKVIQAPRACRQML